MKRVVYLCLSLILLLSICSCGSSGGAKETPTQAIPPVSTSPQGGGETSNIDSMDQIEADSGVFDVTLTIPAEFAEEDMTQEKCDAIAAENGYKSVTLQEDGSLTYVVTKAQHEKMLREVAGAIDESLQSMSASEEYPNFVSIDARDHYTKFTVITKGEDLDLNESFSIVAFYMFGGMYGAFKGTVPDNISVEFINEASGAVIRTANSNEMG